MIFFWGSSSAEEQLPSEGRVEEVAVRTGPAERKVSERASQAVLGAPRIRRLAIQAELNDAEEVEVWTGREADEISEWAARTALRCPQSWRHAFPKYAAELSAWSDEHVDSAAKSLPVIYPFSGADVLMAVGLFPEAPAYMLIAEFKPGHRRSLFDEDGRKTGDVPKKLRIAAGLNRAQNSALRWLGHVASRNFEFSVTTEMHSFFRDVGVLPTLVLAVHLLGYEPKSESSKTRITRVLTTSTACVIDFTLGSQQKTLIYVNTFVSDANDWKRLLEAHFLKERDLQPPFSFLFKAGAHNVARMPWFADVVLETGRFVLQDESGLRVSAYNSRRRDWDITPFGTFVDFTRSQRGSHPDDASEIRSLYQNSQNSTLPFCFGYCEYSQSGTLMTASKKDTATPDFEQKMLRTWPTTLF